MIQMIRKALGLGIKMISRGCWEVAIEGIEAWSGNGLPACGAQYNRDNARYAARSMAEALEETDAEYDLACVAKIKHIKLCRALGLDPWQTAEEHAAEWVKLAA